MVDGSNNELSDEVRRKLIVVPSSKVDQSVTAHEDYDTIQVVWRFDDNEENVEIEKCTHCRHVCGG